MLCHLSAFDLYPHVKLSPSVTSQLETLLKRITPESTRITSRREMPLEISISSPPSSSSRARLGASGAKLDGGVLRFRIKASSDMAGMVCYVRERSYIRWGKLKCTID